mmetsp:Transcript_36794/g.59494  ORF Transcript_36794/g.59494 Transcript_36794/m.59494 type:complete len:535 (+) Transcript_36794:360-1964(+)|eukprot:CAMPEP_0184654406 /NCGR_PEP_ID=MMETSP0308-20130426/12093_1 /TAXON_ID=38269 /ORGANISM="Gloeochaete witrockiana, Strain SAG 46.84" /LENGTH=534 /DNA_ID=CAMNT_0027090379 /DNA_START=294 /DNA_END=1898 /DNA_ORIENTATION=+
MDEHHEDADHRRSSLNTVGTLSLIRSRRQSLHSSISSQQPGHPPPPLLTLDKSVLLPPISVRPPSLSSARPPALSSARAGSLDETTSIAFQRLISSRENSPRPKTHPSESEPGSRPAKFAAAVRFATNSATCSDSDEDFFSRKVDHRLSSTSSGASTIILGERMSSPISSSPPTLVTPDDTLRSDNSPDRKRSGGPSQTRSRSKSRQTIPIDISAALLCEEEKVVWKYRRIPQSEITLGRRLAEGGSAYVLKATYRQTTVAVKQYKPSLMENIDRRPFYVEEIEREAHYLSSFSHANIIKCEGIYWNGSVPSLVLEYLPGTSLNHFLHSHGKKFGSATAVLSVLIEITSALDYLHTKHHTVHRDVKSLNIMLHETKRLTHRAVLIDFGLVRPVPEDGNMTPKTGSYRWCAPEVLRGEPYGFPADVFSFGIVMWECISGRPPYYGLMADEVGELVATEGLRPKFLSPSRIASQEVCDLVHECWREDPAERPTATSLLSSLRRAYAIAVQNEDQESSIAVAARSVANSSSKMCLVM